MKHTLALTLAILLLAATGRGQTNETYTISNSCYTAMKTGWYQISGDITVSTPTNGGDYSNITMTDEGIRKLAASGEICKALGRHFWRPGRPGEGEGSSYGGWYADYHPGTTYRTCAVCGICESKSEGNWK